MDDNLEEQGGRGIVEAVEACGVMDTFSFSSARCSSTNEETK